MKRQIAWITAALVVLTAVGAGIGAWALVRRQGTPLPQISVYSRGTTVRVDPYLFCNVVNLDDCVKGSPPGELPVDARYPVQLSVPARIGDAPWRLLRVYEDEENTTEASFRPGTRLSVTVPTIDPRRGRLMALVVQLITLVKDQNGELRDLPHAEWSVKLNWN